MNPGPTGHRARMCTIQPPPLHNINSNFNIIMIFPFIQRMRMLEAEGVKFGGHTTHTLLSEVMRNISNITLINNDWGGYYEAQKKLSKKSTIQFILMATGNNFQPSRYARETRRINDYRMCCANKKKRKLLELVRLKQDLWKYV